MKTYKIFENSDADLSWLLFLKEVNLYYPSFGSTFLPYIG